VTDATLRVPAHVPLAVATRGGIVEAVHYGSIAVVDAGGRTLHACGDSEAVIFPRSSLKPFQAMPLIAHPEFAGLNFDSREIALCCASHSGEPRHAETVSEMLHKIGRRQQDLMCGTHPPLYFEAMDIRPRAEDIYTPVHHNCSGKHTCMLALSGLLEAPIDGYVEIDHPVQRAVRAAVAHFSGVPAENLVVGIDGCSAPNFALPLAALALAYARLGRTEPDETYGEAPRIIVEAMVAHPEMVSGMKRIDLALAHAGHGDFLPKSGAEAVHAMLVRGRGIGIAIKVADGAARALHVVIVETLRQLGLVGELADTPLERHARPPIRNWRGVTTGEVIPVFTLAPASPA
jgi:L-asparaginase II